MRPLVSNMLSLTMQILSSIILFFSSRVCLFKVISNFCIPPVVVWNLIWPYLSLTDLSTSKQDKHSLTPSMSHASHNLSTHFSYSLFCLTYLFIFSDLRQGREQNSFFIWRHLFEHRPVQSFSNVGSLSIYFIHFPVGFFLFSFENRSIDCMFVLT